MLHGLLQVLDDVCDRWPHCLESQLEGIAGGDTYRVGSDGTQGLHELLSVDEAERASKHVDATATGLEGRRTKGDYWGVHDFVAETHRATGNYAPGRSLVRTSIGGIRHAVEHRVHLGLDIGIRHLRSTCDRNTEGESFEFDLEHLHPL